MKQPKKKSKLGEKKTIIIKISSFTGGAHFNQFIVTTAHCDSIFATNKNRRVIRSHDTHTTQHDDAYEISLCMWFGNPSIVLRLWSNELSWETIRLRAASLASLCYNICFWLRKNPLNTHTHTFSGAPVCSGSRQCDCLRIVVRVLFATHTHTHPPKTLYGTYDPVSRRSHNKPITITQSHTWD